MQWRNCLNTREHPIRPRVTHILTVSMSVTFLRGHVGYLVSNGWDVDVVTSPGPELNEIQEEGAKVFAIAMAREISPLRDLVSLWKLWRLLRQIRPDLVVAGTPKGGLLGTLAARLALVPHVMYVVHGLRLETTTGWKRKLLWLTEWISCRAAQEVRCVSASLKTQMVNLGLSSQERLFVIGSGSVNGIDCDRWPDNAEEVVSSQRTRERLKLPVDATVIGFVGRMTHDKGIHDLFEAFESLVKVHPNAHLLLIGDFEEGDPLPASLRARIEAHPAVIRTGFVRDVDEYYLAMDILALPTYREGFGNVCMEAQAASIPVVTTNATGAVDAILDGITGFIVPVGDVDALRDALGKLINDLELRIRMGRAGRAWVKENFRSEDVWSKTLLHYHATLQ